MFAVSIWRRRKL